MIPEDVFDEMLPRATAWAQQQERFLLSHREALRLTPREQEIARRAGVARAEAVRILGVAEIPSPKEADLRQAAGAFGLISADSVGLALGYGIFMRQDSLNDPKLIAHELKHVAQYERHGGIPAFFRQYLAEVNQYRYPDAPMEREAIAFAESEFPSRGE